MTFVVHPVWQLPCPQGLLWRFPKIFGDLAPRLPKAPSPLYPKKWENPENATGLDGSFSVAKGGLIPIISERRDCAELDLELLRRAYA